MPCSIQPGGISRQMRVRYTAHCKLGLLTAAERLQREEGMTIQKAAEQHMVCTNFNLAWAKMIKSRDWT